MPTPETNDPLDALLRENDGYIEDNGFTARVVAALPRRRHSWGRSAILLTATAIGLVLIMWWLPPVAHIVRIDQQGSFFIELSRQALIFAGVLLLASASVFWSLYAVLQWEE